VTYKKFVVTSCYGQILKFPDKPQDENENEFELEFLKVFPVLCGQTHYQEHMKHFHGFQRQ
jgi:hypothetical protein